MNPLFDTCPWIESPFFEQLLAKRDLSGEEEAAARAYRESGFLVLDDVIDDATCDRIRESVAPLYRDDEPEGPRSRYRVQDAWIECPAVRELAAHPRVLELLRLLYDRRPIPFQTLNFRYGTQQPAHADTLHFTCAPHGFLCGVWVALEDMTPENGPLEYYPGSQRLPEIDYLGLDPADFGCYQKEYLDCLARTFERREFCARKGQALIWAANLWHGGSPIRRPGATRHSQVTHYYFENCFYYAPQNSAGSVGRYRLKDVVDIESGERVEHRYNHVALRIMPVEGGLSILEPDPARSSA